MLFKTNSMSGNQKVLIRDIVSQNHCVWSRIVCTVI